VSRKERSLIILGRRLGFGALLLIMTTAFAPRAEAQIIIDNLTGGTSSHQSSISSSWVKHEWDIIFPVASRGLPLANPVLYYRVGSPNNTAVINGGFAAGNDGAFITSTVNGQYFSSIAPPGTTETDSYFVFDFTGQSINIPADGIVWFRFNWVTGSNWRMDIGALGTFTTTYEQDDNIRSGGTSFAVYSGNSLLTVPVPTLSQWALITLSLLIGFVAFRRYRKTA